MICKHPHCKRESFKEGVCQRHYNKWIQRIEKKLFEERTREKPVRALHVKTEVGIFGNW